MSALPTTVLSTLDASGVRPGRLSDIPFVVREIKAGVAAGHFSPMLAQPQGKLLLLWMCCQAMLRAAFGGRPAAGWSFLVIRTASLPVGAVLSEKRFDTAGAPVTLIGYVMVDRACRRQALATRLVRAVIERAPAGRILCACAPASKGMMQLLQTLRFRPQQRATPVPGLVAPYLFQYRKA
jgi:GNAT superfamily N-acetyltransferase